MNLKDILTTDYTPYPGLEYEIGGGCVVKLLEPTVNRGEEANALAQELRGKENADLPVVKLVTEKVRGEWPEPGEMISPVLEAIVIDFFWFYNAMSERQAKYLSRFAPLLNAIAENGSPDGSTPGANGAAGGPKSSPTPAATTPPKSAATNENAR